MNLTQEQLKVLTRQLGREPRNVAEIAKQCVGEHPQVITTKPILIKDDSFGIFPTTFWLTCPELNYRIGRLEGEGMVQKIQQEIKSNQKLATKLKQAHQNYAKQRIELADQQLLARLKEENEGQYNVLKESGVGGIMDFGGIKCLHTHYAHYLVDPINPVGQLVDDLLQERFTLLDPKECCSKCQGEEE
ncbi:DUF501 domain-containing protein [Natroniella sulfidigena]|uniref:DUF501 domain-containing protein n=1 Tax=Natroniella sulfidigena TaxID=723921 RepID=UPI00200B5DE8|nr:DUF501 domain-containing protein [Natroniella sulfidigena]MCK8817002.1 DUF501 domain-containing protein [Natroniella sulfidigena]